MLSLISLAACADWTGGCHQEDPRHRAQGGATLPCAGREQGAVLVCVFEAHERPLAMGLWPTGKVSHCVPQPSLVSHPASCLGL